MDGLIYTAMSGADHLQRALAVRANNLANAQTTGFRADEAQSEYDALGAPGYDSRLHARLAPSRTLMHSGQLHETGRELDVAIRGDGFFVIETETGTAYSRHGSLVIDEAGALSVHGHPVMGQGGPITLPPHSAVTIGPDGSISVLPQGERDMQVVDMLALVKAAPGELAKDHRGLLVTVDGGELATDDSVRVAAAHLESSNVSAVEELTQTMQLTRAFELQMRLFKAADDMAEQGNRLLRA